LTEIHRSFSPSFLHFRPVSLAPSRDETPTGGPSYDLFVSYAETDRSWVEGYLFDALDAAGIRYVSESAFELGAPRVAEFERAVRASRRTLLVITPAYLADAYAPFGDLLAQTFGVETGTWPVIPLTLEDAPLPPRLAMLVALDATRPETWNTAVERLCAAVNRPLPPATPPPCPYPGMLPFRERDAARFFGRDAEVAEMVERLRLHRFLAVIGPSGTGKSSLVLAGLIPALRSSGLFGSGDWRIVTVRPGAAPLDTLDLALGRNAERDLDTARLLLVCDQFEETFTIGREQAAKFQARLGRLAEHDRCWVVLTVRADFYADLMGSPLWTEVRSHRVEVAPLGDDGLRAAIVRPAEAAGVHVDPPLVERLVSDAAGEPGVLPLVQEALVLSWERLARRYLPLEAYQSIASADGSTGLQAAMARRADATLADLTPERQAIARRVFVRLVQFGEGRADTRRQQRTGDLRAAGDDPAEVDATVDHLVEHRLVTASGAEEGADRRIDLAHEALISGWPTLRGWVAERRDAEQTRRRLDDKAAEWVRLGRGDGGLLDEIELAETDRWLAGPDAAEVGFDPALVDLATASRGSIEQARTARRRRVRAVIGALAVGLLVVTALAVWGALSARSARREEQRAREATARADEQRAEADAQRAEADSQRAEAEALAVTSRSRQLAADSVTQLDRNLDRAMLLAVQAYRTDPTLQAKSALLSALEFSPRLTGYVPAPTDDVPQDHIAFVGDRVAVVDGAGVLRSFDAASGRQLGSPVEILRDPFSPTVVFSNDGRVLAAEDCLTNDPGTSCEIHVWDVASGRQVGASIVAPGDLITEMAFSPDNRLLAVVDLDLENTEVHLWDLDAGAWFGVPMRTYAQSLAFSPDGRLLATGLSPASFATGESSVSLWDVATQRLLAATPVRPAGGVNAVDFSPDGQLVAAGNGWGDVDVLNVPDLSVAEEPLQAPDGVLDVAFSVDGSSLATASAADDHVLLWTLGDPEPEQLSGHEGEVHDLDFDADGQRLASAGVDGRVYFWRVDGQQSMRRAGVEAIANGVSVLAFAGDDVVSAGRAGSRLERLRIPTWNPETGALDATQVRSEGFVALSPDGRVVAVGDEQGTITRFDTSTGDRIEPSIPAHRATVTAIAFGADGQTLVSTGCPVPDADGFSCENLEVAVWDLASGRRIAGGLLAEDFGTRVALSPDGATVAVTGASAKVSLWNVSENRPVSGQLDAGDRVTDIAWSPDSSLLAVASEFGGVHAPGASQALNNKVVVWDVASRRPVGEPLHGGDNGMTAAAFSPDGTVLASGDYAGVIRFYDVDSLSPLGAQITSGAPVSTLRFDPDGRTLASGHGDGQVQLWDMDPEAWIDRLCSAANRDLTDAEWAEFVGDVAYETTCPEAGG
jgi:WD40 repeat protein